VPESLGKKEIDVLIHQEMTHVADLTAQLDALG